MSSKLFLNLDKEDWKDLGKHLGVGLAGLAAFTLTVILFSNWVAPIVTPLITATTGRLIAKNDDLKTKNKISIVWGAIGLVFGILGIIAI